MCRARTCVRPGQVVLDVSPGGFCARGDLDDEYGTAQTHVRAAWETSRGVIVCGRRLSRYKALYTVRPVVHVMVARSTGPIGVCNVGRAARDGYEPRSRSWIGGRGWNWLEEEMERAAGVSCYGNVIDKRGVSSRDPATDWTSRWWTSLACDVVVGSSTDARAAICGVTSSFETEAASSYTVHQ